MIGLYKRRNNNTTATALNFALPTTNIGGLQQAQVTAMQDEIHVLKKQLYEVRQFAYLLHKSECISKCNNTLNVGMAWPGCLSLPAVTPTQKRLLMRFKY